MFSVQLILAAVLSIVPTICSDVKLWSMNGYTLYQTENNTQQNDLASVNYRPTNFVSANLSYSGGYVTVWNNQSNLPIQAQFYDKDGMKSGKNVDIIDGITSKYDMHLSIASLYNNNEDRFAIVYNIYDFTTNKNVITCQIFAGTTSLYKWDVAASATTEVYDPHVIAFHDHLVVSYVVGNVGVFYNVFDNSGNSKGSAVQISTPDLNVYQYANELVKRGDNFVVVWNALVEGTDGIISSNLFYMNFDTTGPTSNLISVFKYKSWIFFSAIALTPSNNLVIAYSNNDQDGSVGNVVTYNNKDIPTNKYTNTYAYNYNLLPCNGGFFSFYNGYTIQSGCSNKGCLISQFFEEDGKPISYPLPTGLMCPSTITSASFGNSGNSASSDFSVTWAQYGDLNPSNQNRNVISGQFKLVKNA